MVTVFHTILLQASKNTVETMVSAVELNKVLKQQLYHFFRMTLLPGIN
jgi:hypothetical protein